MLCPLFSLAQHTQKEEKVAINDTISLQEVSVSGGKERQISGMLSGNISLSVDNIASMPSISGTVDVLKLLELTPSMRTSGDANSNIYVRGGDAGQNLILYGGITTYTPGHALGIFPLFNASHLSALKLSKGSSDVAHGNYLSSVIDVEPKHQLVDTFWAKGNVGILASQFTTALPINKNWSAYISARKTYLNKTLGFALNNSESRGIAYDFWDANISVIGKINSKNTLAIHTLSGKDIMSIGEEQLSLDGQISWKNNLASVQLNTTLSEKSELEQQIYYSGFANGVNTAQENYAIMLNSSIRDITYKNKLSLHVLGVPLNLGISYSHYDLMPYDLQVKNLGTTLSSPQEDKMRSNYVASFLSSKIHLTNRLSATPGIRYNFFSSRLSSENETQNFNSIDARLNLRYEVSESIFLRANYSHNNQYLNKLTPSSIGLPTDFWVTSSSKIRPQYGNEFALGGYHHWNDGMFEFSTDIYYRTMHNATQFEYNFIEQENISFTDKIMFGKGRSYGLELMLKKNYGKFTGWLSYALGKSERQFNKLNAGNYFPAKFDRRHDVSATLNYKINSRFDLSLTQIYATGNTYTQPTSWYFMNALPVKEYSTYNNARLPNYNRTDISLNYWFKPNNGLNFAIYNLFAVQNPIYVFLDIKKEEGDYPTMNIKFKTIFKIMPSISWNFNF